MIEFRIRWNASSNISFNGETDWEPWHDEDATEADVQNDLYRGGVNCEGLSMMLEAAGIDWWVETREADSAA